MREVDPRSLFFPAGHIFVLRQPIVERNQEAWNALKEKLSHADGQDICKIAGEQRGVLLSLTASGNVTTENVIVADCSTVLANLEDAIDLVLNSGILLPEKEYRLDLMGISQSLPSGMHNNVGDPSRGVSAFALCPTENIVSDR